ncbi:hypothetical protein JXL83_00960 [candidate division WOR-3 bacterium]|nr:hypothetical protein [candidate division WOR-3 bacterium]
MKFKNIDGFSGEDLLREIAAGGKFLVFQYCVSIVILTFKRVSAIYFVRGNEKKIKYSFKYSLLTWLFGWWGIPWGPIYTIQSLYLNGKGGKDVTKEVISAVSKLNKKQ